MTIRNSHGIEEARKRFPSLVDEAHRGRTTLITKRGRPYAALVPVEALSRTGRGPDLRGLRGTGKGLWGRTPSASIRRLREEWD